MYLASTGFVLTSSTHHCLFINCIEISILSTAGTVFSNRQHSLLEYVRGRPSGNRSPPAWINYASNKFIPLFGCYCTNTTCGKSLDEFRNKTFKFERCSPIFSAFDTSMYKSLNWYCASLKFLLWSLPNCFSHSLLLQRVRIMFNYKVNGIRRKGQVDHDYITVAASFVLASKAGIILNYSYHF